MVKSTPLTAATSPHSPPPDDFVLDSSGYAAAAPRAQAGGSNIEVFVKLSSAREGHKYAPIKIPLYYENTTRRMIAERIKMVAYKALLPFGPELDVTVARLFFVHRSNASPSAEQEKVALRTERIINSTQLSQEEHGGAYFILDPTGTVGKVSRVALHSCWAFVTRSRTSVTRV